MSPFGKKDEETSLSIKDLHIQTLTRGYWLGSGLTILGMAVVLGFQLYYTLSKGLPVSLSIGTAFAIVAITVWLPHLMGAMALMGKTARNSGIAIIAVIACAALVASYHHMNQMFLETGYSWTAAYLLPLAFDGTAVLGLVFAFGCQNKKIRIQFGLDEYTERFPGGPETNSEPTEVQVTAREVKDAPKEPQKRSESRKGKVPASPKPKAIESGELSDNEKKWLDMIKEVYEPGMSVAKVKEALKARYDKSGSQNTITKLVRIVREDS